MHLPVLLNEAVDALVIKSDGVYVDGTFGGGGHSHLILSRLGKKGRLIAFDKDLAAVAVAAQIDDERFNIRHSSYVRIREELQALKVDRVDGVLLDLGVSSFQLDEEARGFSFRVEGPLDMRMDTSRGETAAEWLNSVTESQLEEVIRSYGEERYAKQVARAIIMARARQPISTTIQLAEIVAAIVRTSGHQRGGKQHPATRTFQAIRVYLNQELEELSLTLPQCVDLLNPGGRLVVISFHSLEDRIVKRFMRAEASADRLPHKLPLRDKEVKALSHQRLRIIGKALRPDEREIAVNPRARSAVMRVAERIMING